MARVPSMRIDFLTSFTMCVLSDDVARLAPRQVRHPRSVVLSHGRLRHATTQAARNFDKHVLPVV